MSLAILVNDLHLKRVDNLSKRLVQAVVQAFFAVFVHQEADSSLVHAIDWFPGIHEIELGLEHETIASQSNDIFCLFGIALTISLDERGAGLPRHVSGICNEADSWSCHGSVTPQWRRWIDSSSMP